MSAEERLAVVLEERGLKVMAAKARTGYYSDFHSPLATPKIQLARELHGAAQDDLVRRVQEGEFDG